MISIETIQELYNNEQFEECLQSIDTFLLFDNKNSDALLIKAKCEYRLAINTDQEEDPEPFFIRSCKSFETVLSLQPENTDALLYAACIYIYFTEDNLHQAIEYCNTLQRVATEALLQINAFDYRSKAYFMLGEADNALSDLSALESLYKTEYAKNRPVLDSCLNDLFLNKGNIYLNQKHDVANCLAAYEDGLPHAFPAREEDIRIAKLAFDNKKFSLGTEAYSNALLTGFRGDPDELMDVYKQAFDLVNTEYESEQLFYALMVTMRQLKEKYFGKDYHSEIFAISKQFMNTYPDWLMPYHFAGTILFEAGKYEEALAYFRQALQRPGGMAITIYRYIVSSWHATGKIPEITHWPDDRPDEYYSAGVFFNEFETEVNDPQIRKNLLQLRKTFYEKSYNRFYDYFYKGIGANLSADVHTFAMCCNNYGIALRKSGEWESAIEIHKLGYSLSPFWEQQFSLGMVLGEAGKDEEALKAFMEAIDVGQECMTMDYYLEVKGNIMKLLLKSGHIDEVRQMLDEVQNEYETFIRKNEADLSEDDKLSMDSYYIHIQNVRADLLKLTATPEDSAMVWRQELEKNPDDTSAWYMLFQHYFKINDYKQSIACADNYLILKGNTVVAEDNCKAHYFRAKSYMNLKEFEKAIQNFKIVFDIDKQEKVLDEHSEAHIFDYLTHCTHELQLWEECLKYGWEAIQCYNKYNWAWDDQLVQVMLEYADACYAKGLKDAARKTVANVLEARPGNEDALKRKKEWKGKGLFSFFRF